MKLALALACLLMFPLCGQATPISGNASAQVRTPPLGTVPYGATWTGGQLSTGVTPFVLPISALLESVDLWLYDTADGSAAWLQDIEYAIYEGATPNGLEVARGSGDTLSLAFTGQSWRVGLEGMVVLRQSFSVTPVFLQANTQYWLAITARTLPSGVSNNARWAEFDDDTRAFVLNGVIPEAPSVLLLLVGALPIVAARVRG